MSWMMVGATTVSVGASIYSGVQSANAYAAQAAQANAAGAFKDYQDRLDAIQKMQEGNQVMDQAAQTVTAIKTAALAKRGQITTAEGASGTVGTVGGAAIANEVIEKGAAADVAATMGSAINKQSSLVEAAMNDNVDAKNAITNAAAQATSLSQAGSAAETGSILSGIAGAGLALAKDPSLNPTSTGSGQATLYGVAGDYGD